jgi:hypothetical protein
MEEESASKRRAKEKYGNVAGDMEINGNVCYNEKKKFREML